jgi:hypothetical protein
MGLARSFRFNDDTVNDRFIASMKKAKVKHQVDDRGVVHYSAADEELVENEVIKSIRDRQFRTWQVLTCPKDWIKRYRTYMTEHHISFVEELSDNQVWFLIARRHRPHSWKLKEVERKARLVG